MSHYIRWIMFHCFNPLMIHIKKITIISVMTNMKVDRLLKMLYKVNVIDNFSQEQIFHFFTML